LDWRSAELQYRWGECSLALSDFPGGREHFQKACDLDALPFRTDSRINGAIENAGRNFAGANLNFFDAAAAMEKGLPSGVCGQETFYEHVHFNFDGNYRLGRAWADEVEKMLPPEISHGAGASAWASREICEQRLGLTDWNRCAMTKLVEDNLHNPPLSGQSNNLERLQSLANDVGEWRRHMTQSAAQRASGTFRKAIEQSPQDHFVVENYAQFLEAIGDLKQAAAQWQHDCQLLPHDCTAYYQAGRLLSAGGQWAEAEASLVKAATLRPRLTEAWGELGNVHVGTGQIEQALQDYERAAQLDPRGASYEAYIGTALSKLNRHAEAIQHYQHALQLEPDLWEAHFALGDELAAANRITEAKDEYTEVVRLKPGSAPAHLELGVMQAKLGLLDDAFGQFQETLRLDPGNRPAWEFIERLQNRRSHTP
jgi:tetratricopeptide (TPR) repeat protein